MLRWIYSAMIMLTFFILWRFSELGKEFYTTLLAVMGGGIFTMLGVFITLEHSRSLEYAKFYLRFNKAQVSINRFIRKSTKLSEKLGGAERTNIRHMFLEMELRELKEDIENAIKSLNKDIDEVDFASLAEDILDINEHSPVDSYYDLNFIIIMMVTIYNSLVEDSQYLTQKQTRKIGFYVFYLPQETMPHHKQINMLKRRNRKVKRKMKIR